MPWWVSALHIFFDSWVHERDALLPLGIEVPVVEDEARPVATYVVGLAATLASTPITTVIAGVRVCVGDGPPEVEPERDVHLDDREIADAIDALCGRGSLHSALRGHDGDSVEQFGTLARFLNV